MTEFTDSKEPIPSSSNIKREFQVIKIDNFGDLQDIGTSDKVKIRTERLFQLAHSVECSVFQIDTQYGRWLIVARGENQVDENRETIYRIDEFQSGIQLHDLWGACTTSHLNAVKAGLADGTVYSSPADTIPDKVKVSIYPGGAGGVGHEIAYKDSGSSTVYFDLTSRVYMFTPTIHDTDSVFNGLFIIDTKGSTRIIDTLYGTRWKKWKKE